MRCKELLEVLELFAFVLCELLLDLLRLGVPQCERRDSPNVEWFKPKRVARPRRVFPVLVCDLNLDDRRARGQGLKGLLENGVRASAIRTPSLPALAVLGRGEEQVNGCARALERSQLRGQLRLVNDKPVHHSF